VATKSLESWVDAVQSRGKYTFLRQDALASGFSPESVKKALQRLARRGRIAKVKNYFYVIVPLEYAHAGSPPPAWFIDDLMRAMGRPYYVGLLSAAALHGAAHHAPQEFQVVTDRFVRSLTVARTRIRFFTSKYLSRAAVNSAKTPTGAMRVSTPETTAVDLVRFAKGAGQLDHVASVIGELAPILDARKLLAAVRVVRDVPNAQRLGYLLDHVDARRLTGPLKNWVDRQASHPVPLRSQQRNREGAPDRRWRVLVDRSLEIES
jgi:predicted transcriptional regulator of viral defense system